MSITDVVKMAISVADISAELIISTPLISVAGDFSIASALVLLVLLVLQETLKNH